MELLNSFCQKVNQEILNIKLEKVSLGLERSESNFILKEPCNILLKIKDEFSLISAEEGTLSYKDRRSLLNGSQLKTPKLCSIYKKIPDEVLIFTHFNHIELVNIKMSVSSGRLFDQFMEIYNGLDETVKTNDYLYMVVNKNINVLNLVYLEKEYIPCVNSKLIKVFIKFNQKNSHFKKLMSYVDQLSEATEVYLKIQFDKCENKLFHETILKVVKSTKVTKLCIKIDCFEYLSRLFENNIMGEMFGFTKIQDDSGQTQLVESDFLLKNLVEFEITQLHFSISNMDYKRRNELKKAIKKMTLLNSKDLDLNLCYLDFIKIS